MGKSYTVSVSTIVSANNPEEAALLFQSMIQDPSHPGWGVRVDENTQNGGSFFVDCEAVEVDDDTLTP